MKPHIFKFWSLYFTRIVSPMSSYIFYFMHFKILFLEGDLDTRKGYRSQADLNLNHKGATKSQHRWKNSDS